MVVPVLPQTVANAFVDSYYVILHKSPENLHKFYQESSLLGWQELDGEVKPVTTLSGINDKVMSSDFKNLPVEIKTVNAQDSLGGGIIVVITGIVTWKNNLKKNFSQTFFLAEQATGFFVLNDILRFFDVVESITKILDKNDQVASPLENSVPYVVSESPTINIETVVQIENTKEVLHSSKDTDAKAVASTSSIALPEKVHPVFAPVSNAKDDAPKISYASMVAKAIPLTYPKTGLVSSNVDNQVVASSITKPSAPRDNVASKVSSPSDGASKISTFPNKATTMPIVNNGASNNSAFGEGRGIYIGGLPSDITKQGVAEVVKKFGPIKRNPDSIQIRRHEDGFCCGFLEFESPDAARRAVEVHYVMFGDKEAYVTYKRSSFSRGSDGRVKSPTRGEFRCGNPRMRENGEVPNQMRSSLNENRSDYNKGQARVLRPRRPLDQWSRDDGKANCDHWIN